ncbi:Serine/threonine-protein kinase Kist [Perkinsus chesapeaki]|uniref:Serine/threonine-protein kinase Kist n=1 Tax=Perkinsus chesapeaki TaxID=330153 RepID=A0A7J6MR33_PERCH|nr:Serine/threonine-protein kinase Kist [Perkinsus chesapeaki]
MQQQKPNTRLLAQSTNLTKRFEESDKIIYNSGFTCTVVQGRDRVTDNKVAIKLVQKKKLVTDAEIERARYELKYHSSLSHPNIVPLVACEETNEGFIAITPYACDGDLYELTHCTTLTEEATRNCISQILAAINYMHTQKRLVHGDIKPHNMLLRKIEGKFILLLCDFGFTEELRPHTNDVLFTQLRGTSGYFAPEQLAGRNYDGKVDVFAAGVITFTLIGGYEPFYPPDNMSEPVEFEPRYWQHVSDEAKDFMRRCLAIDPRQRMSCEEALAHPWLSMGIPKHTSPRGSAEGDYSMNPPPDESIDFWNAKDVIIKEFEACISNRSNDVPSKSESFIDHDIDLFTCADVAAGPQAAKGS